MQVQDKVLQVVLPTPLRQWFDYLYPQSLDPAADIAAEVPQVGKRVRVSFGRRELIGLVVGVSDQTEVPREKLKPVLAVLDETPLLSEAMLAWLLWVARYYHQGPGECVLSALPTLLRQGQPIEPEHPPHWQLTDKGLKMTAAGMGRAVKQWRLIELLRLDPAGLPMSVLRAHGFERDVCRRLQEKGLAHEVDVIPKGEGVGLPDLQHHTPVSVHKDVLAESPLTLNAPQREAVDCVISRLGQFAPAVLLGVTGSGKTEVYLQVIERVLAQGQQALVLVPEIGLTPQTVARFRQRFAREVVLLHSGLNDRERLAAWRAASEGKADIVIGTRSAVFTPLRRPGVIIVDEEHDASFKQQDGFRYHARDLALVRAQREQVPIMLGSATPSLETLAQVERGHCTLLRLPDRAAATRTPPVPQLLDIRNRRLQGGFSVPLLEAMQRHLDRGRQVLVVLNRRGFAPVLMCHACGWVAGCQHCDARMTWHREPPRLHCHHCGHRQPLPDVCPQCGEAELLPLGAGTERGEEILAARFPDVPIIRIDRDSVRGKDRLQEKLADIHAGHPALLIGTQMLAKGHHFPQVTLAAVVDADHGLYSSDPRAMERMAQLLTQVAGRAGREAHAGEVIIQTHHSDDPRLNLLCQSGYEVLAQQLLRERRESHWPPYSHQALWRAEAPKPEAAQALMQALADAAQQQPVVANGSVFCLGPVPAPMERRQGRYHVQLLMQADKRSVLHQLLATLVPWLEKLPEARRARWSLDVDPIELL
ncbi:primosomal protein N' [Terasakiispira papahanaumokuakeensis]|uniref:Replication restart protein PriA n=1 Tax=Terasakiispira papahanaumokuakeensis TaxID=197479 RepID=A0A1E2VB23_9GAMM|nr:primosomal protein N' [Terasakiispira papahanaumokuakeensis]ODC04218.1 primosomal protein N' [Terasakiispira papahanaumokuakeensis]